MSFLAIPFEEYTTTKLATAFATNEAPDIFECSPAIINQYLDAGMCEPLDDIITDDIKQDYTEAAFDRVSRDGVIYGIPLDGDLVGLYYNKEILRLTKVTGNALHFTLLSGCRVEACLQKKAWLI